jgi:hypothetical protein
MRRQSGLVIFIAFAAPLLFQNTLSGLTLRAASWRELRDMSDCVIRGTVAGVQSEKSEEPGAHGVQTRLTFENVAALSGTVPPGFSVFLPGGELDGRSLRVPGAPQFSQGERVVLFLRELSRKEYAICGHGMGVLRESADGARIRPDLPVRGGVPVEGEGAAAFLQRFSATGAAATTPEPAANVSLNALMVLLLIALFLIVAASVLRQRGPKVLTVILVASALAAIFTSAPVKLAASVSSREFKIEGVQWFLQKQRSGQVQDGRVLWVRGPGTAHLPDDATFSAISAQFQQWEDLPDSSIAFRQFGTTFEKGSVINARNVVSFLQNPPRVAFDRLTLAITFIQPIQGTSEIEDADIVFNDRDVDWELNTGDFSVAAVSLHEIGHFLGLDHTTDPATVMFPTAGGLTQLSPGDQAGAAFLYPIAEALPVAVASASPQSGRAPLDVSFSSEGSRLLDGSTPIFFWDFGDGTPPSIDPAPVHTYVAPGVYAASVTVSNANNVATSLGGFIVVDSAESTLTVSKLSCTASLLTQVHGTDKLSLTLSGITLAPGDRVRIQFANAIIGTKNDIGAPGRMELDDTLKFIGDSSVGGVVKLRADPRKSTLTVGLSNALAGRSFDVRPMGGTASSGSALVPVRIFVERASGATELFSADVNGTFTVRSGRSPFGVFEKSIQVRR